MLNRKELEIAAIGISVAAGCIPCTRYHLDQAQKAEASEEDTMAGFDIGVLVSASALDELRQIREESGGRSQQVMGHAADRHAILTGVGAAIARNSVSQFRMMKEMATAYGISDNEIMEVVGLARQIMEKAASHIDPMIQSLDANSDAARSAAMLCE